MVESKWKDYIPSECQPINRKYPESNYGPWTAIRTLVTFLLLVTIFGFSMYCRYHVK